jgi:hypothetical protein
MNAHPLQPAESPEPACAAALDLLHLRLDGETVAMPPGVAAHIVGCADCQGRFAAVGPLVVALARTDLPVAPLFTERLVTGAMADVRRRRRARRWSFAVGLAAGLMAALWFTRPPAAIAPPAPVPEIVRSAPPDLRQDFADAGEAVAALSRRTAADAVDAGRQLIPTVPAPWPPTLEPSRTFDGTGTGLADGFEPVTTSARRAALLFWRELPTTAAKPD